MVISSGVELKFVLITSKGVLASIVPFTIIIAS
jgi:hypothetical protein